MKLWEIKAQALRLMFADTDVEFSQAEFENNSIYDNANTREKLVRMEDSIRRAIDLYFQYNGESTRVATLSLRSTTVGGVTTYFNDLNLTSIISVLNYPTRIDLIEDIDNNIYGVENLTFEMIKFINQYGADDIKVFVDKGLVEYGVNAKFYVYYKSKKTTLPYNQNEITYDLNQLGIPEEVQRQIPLYIKSEIYQEDEPQLAAQAKSEFIQFLVLNQRENFTKVQTKVKRAFKRNFNV